MNWILLASIMVALLAFGLAIWLLLWVKRQPQENLRIREIGSYIKQGARTFLKREYKMLFWFTLVAAILILLFLPKFIWQDNPVDNIWMAISYIFGTLFSGIAGIIGMEVATSANMRTAEAAKKGIKPAFLVGFRGGSVMGMAVVGGSLLGVALVFFLVGNSQALLGFSFGASSLALFAKAGGGIFTKTADISADLVGKVELGIPEDDPRNPAVIADNVGDNVGDVAGMGADLFDSNVASISAALVMAISLDAKLGNTKHTTTVFVFAILGLLASMIGILFARMGKKSGPTSALNKSTYITTGLYAIFTAVATYLLDFEWRIYGAAMIGLVIGVVIGITSDLFTNDAHKPVKTVAEAAQSGSALTLISGMSYGFLSVMPAIVGIAISALGSYLIMAPLADGFFIQSSEYGMFGISMAAVGMLSIVGMIISNDAYGPIVDNARGLAEMGNLGDEVLDITDELDSAGNTVKASNKRVCDWCCRVNCHCLLGAFMSEVNMTILERGLSQPLLTGFDIMDPLVFFGLLVGSTIPAVFSALLMLGVEKNASKMVKEIHRQFDEIEGLKEGKAGVVPEYDKCIEIGTLGALKELIPAGLFAIILTLLVGFIGGVKAIGGFLTGNIITGLLLALFMSNSGGLWDNSKKYIEAGNFGGKGSDAHKAAVVGDTVGDPFKDTAGPSINTQITVVSLVASLMSSIFLLYSLF